MRGSALSLAALLLLLAHQDLRAAAPAASAEGILASAVEAHGGEQAFGQILSAQRRTQGTDYLRGSHAFTLTESWKYPDKMTRLSEVEVEGKTTRALVTIDGGEGLVEVSQEGQETVRRVFTAEEVNLIEERVYSMPLPLLINARGDGYSLTATGEKEVAGGPATGVKIEHPDHHTVTLYFDSQTHLLVKKEQQITTADGQRTTKEHFYSNYKTFDGLKHWTKVAVHIDGQKALEATLDELKFDGT